MKIKTATIFIVIIVVGMGFYTANLAEVTSYLSDDPKTCINCHVMTSAYKTWQHSSHARVANCNDCHVPHDNIVSKYAYKAKDGLYHSYVFTTRQEPEAIRAQVASKEVIQSNCIRCHNTAIDQTTLLGANPISPHKDQKTEGKCWDCHVTVPHGKITSLSSSQILQDRVFQDSLNIIPKWMEKQKIAQTNK